jgi:hypothetical protein
MGDTEETVARLVVQGQQHEVVDVEKEKDADGQQSKEIRKFCRWGDTTATAS